MPCFHPLKAYLGPIGDSGKRALVFKAGEASPGLNLLEQKCPCGQCIGCRLDYALDWAVRCTAESQMHQQNCFITLTYDDEHLPENGSLRLDHWQKFMKKLRKAFGPVRHFHAGEYGTERGRPHDHALLFGIDFHDRIFHKQSNAGSRIDTSETLSKLWGKGYCSVGDVTFESAGYLARYLIGKPTITKQVKNELGQVVGRSYTDKAIDKYGETVNTETGEIKLAKRPEYLTMSRDEGIGKSWLMRYMTDVYPRDYVIVKKDVKMPPPRYFDKIYEEINPVDMKRIKLDRIKRCTTKEEVWNKFLQKYQLLEVDRDERLKVKEEVKKAQVAFLKKSLEEINA